MISGDKILDVTEIDGTPPLRSVYEAFLLAEDRTIKDPTIVRQIKHEA